MFTLVFVLGPRRPGNIAVMLEPSAMFALVMPGERPRAAIPFMMMTGERAGWERQHCHTGYCGQKVFAGPHLPTPPISLGQGALSVPQMGRRFGIANVRRAA
jgi:hypothetical protein